MFHALGVFVLGAITGSIVVSYFIKDNGKESINIVRDKIIDLGTDIKDSFVDGYSQKKPKSDK